MHFNCVRIQPMGYDYIGKVCERHPELEGLRHRYDPSGKAKRSATRCKGCVKDRLNDFWKGDNLPAIEERMSRRREYYRRPEVRAKIRKAEKKRRAEKKARLVAEMDKVIRWHGSMKATASEILDVQDRKQLTALAKARLMKAK